VKDFRVEIRVKNAALYNMIFDQYPSVAEFCRQVGMSQADVGSLINLKVSALSIDGRGWRPSVLKLCKFLGASPEELFPEALADMKLTCNMGSFEMEAQDVEALMHTSDPLRLLVAESCGEMVHEVLDYLNPQEKDIITQLFGMDDKGERTQKEIAKAYGVSNTRIAQIAGKALRKLRHPLRSRPLEHIMYDGAEDVPWEKKL